MAGAKGTPRQSKSQNRRRMSAAQAGKEEWQRKKSSK